MVAVYSAAPGGSLPAASASINVSCRLPDPLLLPFLQAADETRARAALDHLIHEIADPIIEAAIRRHTCGDFVNASFSARSGEGDGKDLRAETIRLLLIRVAAIRQIHTVPIGNFRSYVKVTARHVCWHHGRKQQRESPAPLADCSEEGALPDAFHASPNTGGICELVTRRGQLRAIWAEIKTLPDAQRAALLLNFRDADGGNALPLLAFCQVTPRQEIARALGVESDDLDAIMEQLPLEDSVIAARLNQTPREVINLRVSARRRLKRRLRGWLEPGA